MLNRGRRNDNGLEGANRNTGISSTNGKQIKARNMVLPRHFVASIIGCISQNHINNHFLQSYIACSNSFLVSVV